MEVKSRYLVIATSLICGAVAVSYLPPDLRTQTWRQSTTHADVIKSALSDAEAAYSTLRLRDSLLDLSSEQRARGERLIILADIQLPGEVLRQLDQTVHQAWENLSIDTLPAMSTLIAVTADTLVAPLYGSPRKRWSGKISYVLPENTDGKTCISAIQLGTNEIGQLMDRAQLSTLLPQSVFFGPCAFYAAFGVPGPAIQKWLESSGHDLALLAEWVHGDRLLAEVRPVRPASGGYGAGPPQCYFGDVEDCTEAAMWEGNRADAPLRGVAAFSTSWLRWRWSTHGLGLNAPMFLSDLLLEVGRDRFARFWTSDAEVESAFADAVGIPLGEWTMRWVQEQYEWPRRRGPSISLANTLLGLLTVVGVLGATSAAARLRHVE